MAVFVKCSDVCRDWKNFDLAAVQVSLRCPSNVTSIREYLRIISNIVRPPKRRFTRLRNVKNEGKLVRKISAIFFLILDDRFRGTTFENDDNVQLQFVTLIMIMIATL